jgi:acyl-ACP--UDP-N-acetylglucosamine O-acyltransferase
MISPLAYVDSAAKIGKNVTIQPFAFIEGNVEIGDDCIIMSGAKILHGTRMGKGNKVHHNAVLGAEPQDFHYTGENSMLIIGDNNDIRENVVVSRATHAGSATRIGNENYLMILCISSLIGTWSSIFCKASCTLKFPWYTRR